MRGQGRSSASAVCGVSSAPYYTDGLMHNLRTERFYEPKMINGRYATADGPIKTFPLRGIKGAAVPARRPALTLEDTVEFFNLVPATAQRRKEGPCGVSALPVAWGVMQRPRGGFTEAASGECVVEVFTWACPRLQLGHGTQLGTLHAARDALYHPITLSPYHVIARVAVSPG